MCPQTTFQDFKELDLVKSSNTLLRDRQLAIYRTQKDSPKHKELNEALPIKYILIIAQHQSVKDSRMGIK